MTGRSVRTQDLGPLEVAGLGLWTLGHAGVEAWRRGEHDPEIRWPATAEVNPRLKRGTSLLTNMCVDAVLQAGAQAGVDLSAAPTVFGSAHGEIQIAIEQLDMMREADGIVSPARFKNSVHNTAAGILSIATANGGFTTALAGGGETLAICLLEAWGLVSAGHGEVVVVVGDEPLPEPLDRYADYEGLAVAFALRRGGTGQASLGRLARLRVDGACGLSDAPLPFRANPCAPALTLLDHILTGEAGAVPLLPAGPAAADGAPRWCVDWEPAR